MSGRFSLGRTGLGGQIRLGAIGAWILLGSCQVADRDRPPFDPQLGGETTVAADGPTAFSLAARNLSDHHRGDFAVGNSLFNRNWVSAPASTTARDGLGPLFNVRSCSGCHLRDGRSSGPAGSAADAPAPVTMVFRVSTTGEEGASLPHPAFGTQLSPAAIQGVTAEAEVRVHFVERPGSYPDGTPYSLRVPRYEVLPLDSTVSLGSLQLSPRVAPAVIGLGLLEAVPEEEILALADPDDRDGDGISGRANWIPDPDTGESDLGRFGWKANVPTIRQQTAGAFAGDLGVTSSLVPVLEHTASQVALNALPTGGEPEIEDRLLDAVTLYVSTLGVPAARGGDRPEFSEGRELFQETGCAACHIPTLETGPSPIDALARQRIHPYTDLLVHDMGPDLADGRPDFEATGTEWRTPPLWGIGLLATVGGHTDLLHDGRARSIEEAILWHGGEAEAAREAFRALTARQRASVVAFLESL